MLVCILGHLHGAELWEIGIHLRRRLGTRRHLEDHPHAVDRHLPAHLDDLTRGHSQAIYASRDRLAGPGVHAALRVARQEGPVHVDAAPRHRVAGDHILIDRVLGEALRREDLHLAGRARLRIDERWSAAVVVAVAVAVNDCEDGPLAQVRGNAVIGRCGAFNGVAGVKHDPAGVSLDGGDVGQVLAADLEDALVYLKRPVVHVELGVAPQTRVRERASITQRKTAQPVRFEITELTRQSLERWIANPEMFGADFLWPSRFHDSPHLSTRQYARILREWVTSIGLDPSSYGTHSMRRTKVDQIYKKPGNLRAVQLLLGHTKMDSMIRYLSVELDDARTISEANDL